MNRRGFTLIEIVITLVIVAILAALAIGTFEATRRNTSLDGISLELAGQTQGLRFTALAEQRDHLLVVVSPPGNDVSGCGILSPDSCLRAFLLRSPQLGWSVTAFDPGNPANLADYVETNVLPRGITLDLAGAGAAAPDPFTSVTSFAPDVTANCPGARFCMAIRFSASGEVRPEYAGAPGVTRSGVVIGLTSDLRGRNAAAQRRGLLVSFPSGITRSFPY